MVKNFQKLNKKKIIFLVNDLDFVLSHRLELINSLKKLQNRGRDSYGILLLNKSDNFLFKNRA